MNFDKLEQSVKNLNAVINKFPICAISLDDFKPVEEKIQTVRMSLMHLTARFLLLTAKSKQYTDNRQKRNRKESKGDSVLEEIQIISDTHINTKAIKLCVHSITVLSMLSNKEGTVEDQEKLYINMRKLFNLTEKIMAIQKNIEKTSQVQLNLKIECQKAFFNYKNFLREQEQIRKKRLQKTYPEIINTKSKMEKNLRKINTMKKLITSFIATSDYMLADESMLEMLENHRELINVETIMEMSQNEELADM